MEKKFKFDKNLMRGKSIINDTTNFISLNFPKSTITKLSNSVNSNQKILLQDNTILNNNSSLKLSFKNNDINTINNIDISKDKDKNNDKNKNTRNKTLLQISIKKNKNKTQNFQNYQNDKNEKSPQTIFQKIIIDLDKVKTKTNKTIDVMRKNLKKSRFEIIKRRNYQKQSQLVPTNILNYERNEEKKDF